MTITPSLRGRALRDRAGGAMRWITRFEPFGLYTPSLERH